MKALIDRYGAACAARAAAECGPSMIAKARARESEIEARRALDAALFEVTQHVSDLIALADNIHQERPILRASGRTSEAQFTHRYRKPTMKDAKRNAGLTAKRLRLTWEVLDPSGK